MVKNSIKSQGTSLINFSCPREFEEKVLEMYNLLEKDQEFLEAVKEMNPRYNKINKQNSLKSAKWRFIAAKYILERKKQTITKKEKENAEANTANQTEKDI